MKSLSRNECHALIQKAAKGAGFYWGEADEIADCVLLAGDYFEPLLAIFDAFSPFYRINHAPVYKKPHIASAQNPLCPLLTGIFIMDRVRAFLGQKITLEPIKHSVLLVGFLQKISLHRGSIIKAQLGENFYVLGSGTVEILPVQIPAQISAEGGDYYFIIEDNTADKTPTSPQLPQVIEMEDGLYQQFFDYYTKTLVEASAESRLKGAG